MKTANKQLQELSINSNIRLTRFVPLEWMVSQKRLHLSIPGLFLPPSDPSLSAGAVFCQAQLSVWSFHLFTIQIFFYYLPCSSKSLRPPTSEFPLFLSCPELFLLAPASYFLHFVGSPMSPRPSVSLCPFFFSILLSLSAMSPDPLHSFVLPCPLLEQWHRLSWPHTKAQRARKTIARVHAHRHRQRVKSKARSPCSVCRGEHIAWGLSGREWKLSPVRYWMCIYVL